MCLVGHPVKYSICGSLISNDILPVCQGICEAMRVEALLCLSSITSSKSSLAICSKGHKPESSSIDKCRGIRAIQVKTFDQDNHTIKTSFLHSILEKHENPKWIQAYQQNEKKVSCLFGAHLLPYFPDHPIALVEAPKTAIYGTLYFGLPQPNKPNTFLWMAVYNLSSLTFDRCRVLAGREVHIFPDVSVDGRAYKLWKDRVKEIQKKLPNSLFIVSDYLEKVTTEKERVNGWDLGDYLVGRDWKGFK